MTDVFPGPDPLSEAKTIRVETARDPVSAMRRDAEEGLAPGTLLAGRYLLKGELGRGGMGIVYKAFDRKLERRVALKVLRKALLLDGDHLQRFEAEAKVTARLQHPAILPLYEVGQDDGRTFYTMKIVEGRCLVDLAEQGWRDEAPPPDRWSLNRALAVVGQVCRAVAYAHGHGVLHRDLKPGNVMVGRYGEVHVLDWGLAKVMGGPATTAIEAPLEAQPGAGHLSTSSDETTAPSEASTLRVLTNAGEIVGTPAYMAPEQATGQLLDARADVYALGGLLYSVLCGHLPHEGTTSEVMLRLSRGVLPPPPSHHRKDIPAALDALVLRAMAPDPAERIPSAEDLADALEGWLEGRRPLASVRAQDAEFVRAYRPSEFRRPSVTVDLALVHARAAGPPLVFLQLRARPPYLGCWALPGGFLRMEEPLEHAARRILKDEAGVADPGVPLVQVGAFGDPERDPRTRVVTVAYLALVADHQARPDASAPAAEAVRTGWFAVTLASGDGGDSVLLTDEAHPDEPIEAAFDHGLILAAVVRHLRRP